MQNNFHLTMCSISSLGFPATHRHPVPSPHSSFIGVFLKIKPNPFSIIQKTLNLYNHRNVLIAFHSINIISLFSTNVAIDFGNHPPFLSLTFHFLSLKFPTARRRWSALAMKDIVKPNVSGVIQLADQIIKEANFAC